MEHLGIDIHFALRMVEMEFKREIAVVVQSLSHVWFFVTPWTAARPSPLSSTISWSLLKFMSIESVKLSNHLILCHSLLLLPSIFLSIKVFPTDSALLHQVGSFSISPSNGFDLLAVQGTLKSILQHHRSKASILQHSAFFMVQLSHPYMSTRKNTALTIWTFVGKVMSLFLNTLSMFFMIFYQGVGVF